MVTQFWQATTKSCVEDHTHVFEVIRGAPCELRNGISRRWFHVHQAQPMQALTPTPRKKHWLQWWLGVGFRNSLLLQTASAVCAQVYGYPRCGKECGCESGYHAYANLECSTGKEDVITCTNLPEEVTSRQVKAPPLIQREERVGSAPPESECLMPRPNQQQDIMKHQTCAMFKLLLVYMFPTPSGGITIL